MSRSSVIIAVASRRSGWRDAVNLPKLDLPAWTPLAAGLVVAWAPTLWRCGVQSWSSEQGQYAVLVLILGAWLVARSAPAVAAAPYRPLTPLVFALAALGILTYLGGRLSDKLFLECWGLYALTLGAAVLAFGSALKAAALPLGYMALGLPASPTGMAMLTGGLRLWITWVSVASVRLAGLEASRDGLNILVDQYQITMREACSGLNSIISLTAVGLMYITLRRQRPVKAALVMLPILVLLALVANYVRVICLILATHFLGEEVAQSFLHEGAGVVTFAVALGGAIAADHLLARAIDGRGARA